MSTPVSGMSSAMYAREVVSRDQPIRPKDRGVRVALLAGVPLFAGLSKRHLRRIAGLAEEVRYAAGRSVVRYGGRGDAFFVIVDGQVKVMLGYSSRALARLGPGEFFGELALLDGGPRTASVVAETPVTAIKIPRAGFSRMVKSEPEVSLKLLEELSRRLLNERSATQ